MGDNTVSRTFISGNKCITLLQDRDSEEDCACLGAGVHGNSMLSFAVKLRLFKKKSLLKGNIWKEVRTQGRGGEVRKA